MAQKTILTSIGVPGGVRTFTAKSAGGHPVSHITVLTPMGLPGGKRTFSSKSPAYVNAHPVNHITILTVAGIPGGRRTFYAKKRAFTPGTPGLSRGELHGYNRMRMFRGDKRFRKN